MIENTRLFIACGYTIFEGVFPRAAKILGFKNTRFHCITIMLIHLAPVERIVLILVAGGIKLSCLSLSLSLSYNFLFPRVYLSLSLLL